jgi:hypothetical protein
MGEENLDRSSKWKVAEMASSTPLLPSDGSSTFSILITLASICGDVISIVPSKINLQLRRRNIFVTSRHLMEKSGTASYDVLAKNLRSCSEGFGEPSAVLRSW